MHTKFSSVLLINTNHTIYNRQLATVELNQGDFEETVVCLYVATLLYIHNHIYILSTFYYLLI